MSLLSPPTDSLPKFIAISGVAFLFGIGLHESDVYKQSREQAKDKVKEEIAMLIDSADCNRRIESFESLQKKISSDMKRLANIGLAQKKFFEGETEKLEKELQSIAKCSVDTFRQQMVFKHAARIDSLWADAARDVSSGSTFFNVGLVISSVLMFGGFFLWHLEEQEKKQKAKQLYPLELRVKKAELFLKEIEIKRQGIIPPWLSEPSAPPMPVLPKAPDKASEKPKI